MDSMKKETIINEEQRSYIEVLKQTLENNIFKVGFSNVFESQRYVVKIIQ